MNIVEYIPAGLRKPVYGVLAVVFLIIGAVQVAYAAIDAPNPQWLVIALAVVPFVASAVGFTAQGNTTVTKAVPDTEDTPEADEDDSADEPSEFDEDVEDVPTELDELEQAKADEQAALDEKLADQTPVPDDYEPRH